jgi:hypothetical protein
MLMGSVSASGFPSVSASASAWEEPASALGQSQAS